MIETPHAPSPDARGPRPRIAVAHDWLCGYRGGEAVLERIAALVEREFEPVGLYVMFDDGRPLSPTVDAWRRRGLITSWSVGRSALGARARRWLLPTYPGAVERLSHRLAADHGRRPIDLLISSSSAAIKGMAPPPGIAHLCYCHSPARYVWSQRDQYGGGPLGGVRTLGLALYGRRFRAWDRATASRVTRFIANSRATASEVRRCFDRDAAVIHPPVRTDYFHPDAAPKRESFWLLVGALEPYKRADLAIDAAALAGAELVIAGGGSQRGSLERRPAGRVRFLGRVGDDQLRALYRSARLLLFPQVEDFGIVAAEALACGLPVVARAAGGALDIVTGQTGAFFDEPAPAAIAAAAATAPAADNPACRAQALRFSQQAFDESMLRAIRAELAPRQSRGVARTP
jgi:glycosyltransferase involved in cell wall biosynthesis